MSFFLYIDVKSTSISRKIDVLIESHFQFSVSIDVLQPFERNKYEKYDYFRGK